MSRVKCPECGNDDPSEIVVSPSGYKLCRDCGNEWGGKSYKTQEEEEADPDY